MPWTRPSKDPRTRTSKDRKQQFASDLPPTAAPSSTFASIAAPSSTFASIAAPSSTFIGTRSTSQRMPEQRTSNDRKQHLYLVFDDWHSGYSIRKVSLSRRSSKRSGQSSSSDSGEEQLALSSGPGKDAKPKPLPVFMRVSAHRGYPEFFTSAFGTKIMMMLQDVNSDIPTIDVQDLTFTFEPQLYGPVSPIFIPVSDDSLFTLDISTFGMLRKPDPSAQWVPGHSGQWVWQPLNYPPFLLQHISSYGVLPDGCILVSTKSGATFTFDTKEYVWKKYGNWKFPFTGRGHYDSYLEGFVGLSKDPETLGYLYCSTMVSTATGTGLHPSPDLKCTKSKVYNKNPAEGHVSATLVHLRRGKFCLVECVSIGKRMTDQELDQEFRVPLGVAPLYFVGGGPQCGRFMYRSMTFSLSYDTKGDLKLKNSKVRYHSLPHEARIGSICKDPVAFWL